MIISKLTEAAWIQDTRTPAARRTATLELFAHNRRDVTAILMLRAFRESADRVPNPYQLVEMPASVLDGREAIGRERPRRIAAMNLLLHG